MRLDIRLLPLARMMNSLPRRVSFMSAPSGVRVSARSSKGFTREILQETSGRRRGAECVRKCGGKGKGELQSEAEEWVSG